MKISCCIDANCNDCVKPKTAVSGGQPPFSYVLNTGIKTALLHIKLFTLYALDMLATLMPLYCVGYKYT